MRNCRARLVAAAVCAGALAACSPGGSGISSGLPATVQPGSKAGTASVSFHIVLPTAQTNALRRAPQYISAATASASVIVTPSGGNSSAPTTIACTTTACSGTVNAPLGSDTFTVNLYGASNTLLSTGTATQTIAIDQANAVNLTFNGVVASLALSVSATTLTVGTPTTVTVAVTALDAAGETIVGAGDYVNASGTPITVSLNNSATSGVGALTQTSLAGPSAAPITFSYDGTAIADPVITAAAPSLTSATATLGMTEAFAETGAVQPFSVPSGVTSITITAAGAEGDDSYGGGTAGHGAVVTATLPVNSIPSLFVYVGGWGTNDGFNGGGGFHGSAGGGASDVRTSSTAALTGIPATDPRLIVAGGGGSTGSSPFFSSGAPGGDGGAVGGSGGTASGAGGGGGGTQTAGGAAGSASAAGSPGVAGLGGAGAFGGSVGGNGGGGWFGGGGGGDDTVVLTEYGGGGGSSYVESAATNVSSTAGGNPNESGRVVFSW